MCAIQSSKIYKYVKLDLLTMFARKIWINFNKGNNILFRVKKKTMFAVCWISFGMHVTNEEQCRNNRGLFECSTSNYREMLVRSDPRKMIEKHEIFGAMVCVILIFASLHSKYVSLNTFRRTYIVYILFSTIFEWIVSDDMTAISNSPNYLCDEQLRQQMNNIIKLIRIVVCAKDSNSEFK